MEKVKHIIFRRLTTTDFFNINKPPGIEEGGGGQSYIDIPTSAVNLSQWERFFEGIDPRETPSGHVWTFRVYSLGFNGSQMLSMGQRRGGSFNIRAQKISSRESNRVYAWHPNFTNFPVPANPSVREPIENLVIYLVSLEDGTYWAGWFQKAEAEENWQVNEKLREMFTRGQGFIQNEGDIFFDSRNSAWPFRIIGEPAAERRPSLPQVTRRQAVRERVPTVREEPPEGEGVVFTPQTEQEILKKLFEEDEADSSRITPSQRGVFRKIKIRNQKAARLLKELYRGRCQITGDSSTFVKKDGNLYSEIHHLIPLGEGGSDSIFNLIVVSPLVHKMLHYADVSSIDLSKIEDDKLKVTINSEEYTITWRPEHANIVASALKKE